jgi:hypothetical protein
MAWEWVGPTATAILGLGGILATAGPESRHATLPHERLERIELRIE